MKQMLRVENIAFSFGKKEVFRSVSFQLEKGQLCALFGPNGAGKTTLLKCVAGLHPVAQGKIRIGDEDIGFFTAKRVARTISYVPQEHRITFPYPVKDVVLMGRTPYLGSLAGPALNDTEATRTSMELVGITDIADRPYTRLSGGQRQLVLLARALAQDTPVMLFDEPASNLDFKNQLLIWNLMRTLAFRGKAVLVCTHDPNHVLWFCNKVIVMNEQGNVIADGRPGKKLTGDMLNMLYGDICQIATVKNRQTVVPT